MSSEILRLENIEKYYSGSVDKLHIIRNLNLSVEEGEFISILGRSGSGKSTLLNVIGLLDKIDSEIEIQILASCFSICLFLNLKEHLLLFHL